MAAKTRAELVTEVIYEVGNRTDQATKAITWLERAYQYATQTYELPEALATASVSTAAGIANYDLPDNYFSIYSLRNTTQDRKLIQISQPEYDSLSTTRQDSPTHYSLFSNDIWVHPTPDAIKSLQLRYRKVFTALSGDSSVHELPVAWEVILISLASSYGFRALNELERASFYQRTALRDAEMIHKRIQEELLDRNEAINVLGG